MQGPSRLSPTLMGRRRLAQGIRVEYSPMLTSRLSTAPHSTLVHSRTSSASPLRVVEAGAVNLSHASHSSISFEQGIQENLQYRAASSRSSSKSPSRTVEHRPVKLCSRQVFRYGAGEHQPNIVATSPRARSTSPASNMEYMQVDPSINTMELPPQVLGISACIDSRSSGSMTKRMPVKSCNRCSFAPISTENHPPIVLGTAPHTSSASPTRRVEHFPTDPSIRTVETLPPVVGAARCTSPKSPERLLEKAEVKVCSCASMLQTREEPIPSVVGLSPRTISPPPARQVEHAREDPLMTKGDYQLTPRRVSRRAKRSNSPPKASQQSLERPSVGKDCVPSMTIEHPAILRFCEELQKYKIEQDALIRNMSSRVEMRLQSMEANLAAGLGVIDSMVKKVNELCASSALQSCTSVSGENDSIAPAQAKSNMDDRQDPFLEPCNSERSKPGLWSPLVCAETPTDSKLVANIREPLTSLSLDYPDMPTAQTLSRQAPLERLGGILAEMASSWIDGSSSNVEFEQGLVRQMEHVCEACESLQRAIHIERYGNPVGAPYSIDVSAHHHCKASRTPSFPVDGALFMENYTIDDV